MWENEEGLKGDSLVKILVLAESLEESLGDMARKLLIHRERGLI